jgi:hypothetical protein
MAAAKRQAERQRETPRTPKKPKVPEKPLIGSSSTWNQDELDRFKVECRTNVDPKSMIPPKFFNFETLEEYETSKLLLTVLTVVRQRLMSITPDDLLNTRVLIEKASYFLNVFLALRNIQNLKVTETRKDNLAAKRQRATTLSSEVAPVWVGPPAPPQSAEETRRVASISDPSKSSSGGNLFHATQERETELLGNLFCLNTLTALFPTDLTIDWTQGRPQPPILQWSQKYPRPAPPLPPSSLIIVPWPQK